MPLPHIYTHAQTFLAKMGCTVVELVLKPFLKHKTYALIIVVLKGEDYESNSTFNTGPSSNTLDIFYIFIDGLWKG